MRRGVTPGATLLSLDLDLFKRVNDTYGHAVGDEVLREVGARLWPRRAGPHDIAGRLGGDELALFLPGLAESAPRCAGRTTWRWPSPRRSPRPSGALTVGVSVGVLVLESWGGVPSAGTVLRHADQAMYHAKRAGGGIHLYDLAETRARRRRGPPPIAKHHPGRAPAGRRYRQIFSSPCSPTRGRPSANRSGANGARSTVVAAPSRISSPSRGPPPARS